MLITLQIANAVVAEINTAAEDTFSEEFTAERKIIPSYDVRDLVDIKVCVVPKGVEIEKLSRTQDQYDLSCDIGIFQKIDKDTEQEVERLAGLVGKIVEFITRRDLTTMPGIRWHKTSNDMIYNPDMLESQRVFMSVITVEYKATSA